MVTLPVFDNGQDVELRDFSVKYLGEPTAFHNLDLVRKHVTASNPELKQYDPTAVEFMLRYEASLYLSNPKVGDFLDRVIAGQDVITCEYPFFAPMLSQFCRKHGKPLIVTSHDVLYELHGRHPRGKERLMQLEIGAMRLADALVFCNDQERTHFAEFGLTGRTVINTGDVRSIALGREATSRDAIRATLKLKTAEYCLFVGTQHLPNVEAVVELRRIARQTPTVTFVIAGTCAPAGIEANVISLGFVSEEMLDLLYRGALAVVVPLLKGTGTSVKTFQALAYGKPTISTSVGARGLPVTDGRDIMIVSGPSDFTSAINRLLNDAALRASLGGCARRLAESLDYRTEFVPYGEIIAALAPRRKSESVVTTRRLIVADNNLCDRVGHHFNYTRVLRDECARRGAPFSALVKRTASEQVCAELDAIGTFSFGIHEPVDNPYPTEWGNMRSTYDLLVANELFARELAIGLSSVARIGDVVFLPNATARQIIGLATLLVNKPIFRSLRYVVLLRYSTSTVAGPIAARKSILDKQAAEWYQIALERLVAADQDRVVRLATDSAELAKEYDGLCKRRLEVLPIPHTFDARAEAVTPIVPAKRTGVSRIVFLGDAREEKGFELLPAVVRACMASSTTSPCEFVFQAYITSHFHYRMSYVIDELERLKLPNLYLIKRSLSTDEYETLLGAADMVLLPYDAITYRARTSGPFVESICAGKPVVVPANSWMATQLGDSSAGASFMSGNASDLARAVVTLLRNLPQHTMAAADFATKFRRFHNPGEFVSAILDR